MDTFCFFNLWPGCRRTLVTSLSLEYIYWYHLNETKHNEEFLWPGPASFNYVFTRIPVYWNKTNILPTWEVFKFKILKSWIL